MNRVYIVPGWSYTADKWDVAFSELRKRGVEPIMLKVPGLTAPSDEVWDLDKYVNWLDKSTKAHQEPFILIGHSNGGRVSAAFTGRYPDRVKQLILIDSAGVYHHELSLRLKRGVYGGLAKIGRRVTRSSRLRRLLYKMARVQDYDQAPPNMRQTMANLIIDDRRLRFEAVKSPTTIIWGIADRVTPLADGRYIQARIVGSRLRLIEGARHAPFYTHPAEVAQLIAEAIS